MSYCFTLQLLSCSTLISFEIRSLVYVPNFAIWFTIIHIRIHVDSYLIDNAHDVEHTHRSLNAELCVPQKRRHVQTVPRKGKKARFKVTVGRASFEAPAITSFPPISNVCSGFAAIIDIGTSVVYSGLLRLEDEGRLVGVGHFSGNQATSPGSVLVQKRINLDES